MISLADIDAVHWHMTEAARASFDHGARHWRDVARVGSVLCAAGVDADRDVLLLFAATHDTQRHNEFKDPEHGERAANLVMRMHRDGDLQLAEAQLEVLVTALSGHDRGESNEHVTVGACWDADRLTLSRVGITPDRHFLSTDTARESDFAFSELGRRIVAGPDLDWDEIVNAYRDRIPTDRLEG